MIKIKQNDNNTNNNGVNLILLREAKPGGEGYYQKQINAFIDKKSKKCLYYFPYKGDVGASNWEAVWGIHNAELFGYEYIVPKQNTSIHINDLESKLTDKLCFWIQLNTIDNTNSYDHVGISIFQGDNLLLGVNHSREEIYFQVGINYENISYYSSLNNNQIIYMVFWRPSVNTNWWYCFVTTKYPNDVGQEIVNSAPNVYTNYYSGGKWNYENLQTITLSSSDNDNINIDLLGENELNALNSIIGGHLIPFKINIVDNSIAIDGANTYYSSIGTLFLEQF